MSKQVLVLPKKKKPLLRIGEVVITKNNTHYEVVQMLGGGVFGEVYKVSLKKNPEKVYALKVEANIYKIVNTCNTKYVDISHFVRMLDLGATPSFKFYLMNLIGMSLKDVIETVLGGVTSPHTKIAIARQTLAAIESLHKLGFIHRDIKWHNFYIGLPPNEHIIYILDFDIARPFLDDSFVPLVPRLRVPFMGTYKYATIAGLQDLEQGRKEDLEMWLYMMMEVYDKSNITWADDWKKRADALRKKKALFKDPKCVFIVDKLNLPLQFVDIITDRGFLNFWSRGCY